MIHLVKVTKRFGSKDALKEISFSVRPGEVVGLLGHNGAGKTTALRLIAALLAPTEGRIERPDGFKSQLGYFPDEPFLFEYLTGREMLHFMACLYQVPGEVARNRADKYLQLFELEKQADQLLVTYSRGMRRKISLAGSLLHDPAYWLLDEPTEALDPAAIRNLKDLIAAQRHRNRAVLLSTHLLTLAENVCDRLVILDHGRLSFDGRLADLQSHTGVYSSLEDLYLKLVAAN